jgi:hypothetical protein
MTRGARSTLTSPKCFAGVRFRPGKASVFLSVPATNSRTCACRLTSLWLDAVEVRDALAVECQRVERVRALERCSRRARRLTWRAA